MTSPLKHLQKPTATRCVVKSDILVSLAVENSCQVERLACWICHKDFSSEACIVQHYDDHMRM